MTITNKLDNKMYNNADEITEGEEFIAHFLRSDWIKFHTQVKIENLKDDIKSFRMADFYLPNYKIYIEFFGRWNVSEEDKAKYRKKKKVYSKNNIPCIYIYPENLGTIGYTFDYRLIKELNKYNMDRQLLRYRLKLLLSDKGSSFFWLLASIVMLLFTDYDSNTESNIPWIILWGSVIIYQIGRLTYGYIKYFVRTR